MLFSSSPTTVGHPNGRTLAAVPSRFDLDEAALGSILPAEPAYRLRQLRRGLLEGREPAAMTDLPKALRSRLADEPALQPGLGLVHEAVADDGQTVKWLWELGPGGPRIETVLMHYPGRTTVCVSSQAGCAMGCSFCATGQLGFERNLSAGEIVEQVVRARATAGASGRRLGNVVFMGMGEPLANTDRVWAAVHVLHDDLGISARHLTISTVGVVPGIARLASADLPVNLAVSLHAATDDLRNQLVPLGRRYPLDVLVDACARYVEATRRRLSLEWALIAGTNDTAEQADALAAIASQLRAHVNLIPLNPTPGYPATGSSPASVRAFRDRLVQRGVNTTVRRNRGTDIDAACGQLRASMAGSPVALVRR
jgi:23S rRNA (adenine2503-C2)-methyltransferase